MPVFKKDILFDEGIAAFKSLDWIRGRCKPGGLIPKNNKEKRGKQQYYVIPNLYHHAFIQSTPTRVARSWILGRVVERGKGDDTSDPWMLS